MPARTEALARRKEELRLKARIQRVELALHVRELRRLRKPAHFALIGARVLRAWRSPAWVSGIAALMSTRGIDSGRVIRALRYAGFAFAAWRTYSLIRQYVGSRAGASRAPAGGG